MGYRDLGQNPLSKLVTRMWLGCEAGTSDLIGSHRVGQRKESTRKVGVKPQIPHWGAWHQGREGSRCCLPRLAQAAARGVSWKGLLEAWILCGNREQGGGVGRGSPQRASATRQGQLLGGESGRARAVCSPSLQPGGPPFQEGWADLLIYTSYTQGKGLVIQRE